MHLVGLVEHRVLLDQHSLTVWASAVGLLPAPTCMQDGGATAPAAGPVGPFLSGHCCPREHLDLCCTAKLGKAGPVPGAGSHFRNTALLGPLSGSATFFVLLPTSARGLPQLWRPGAWCAVGGPCAGRNGLYILVSFPTAWFELSAWHVITPFGGHKLPHGMRWQLCPGAILPNNLWGVGTSPLRALLQHSPDVPSTAGSR